MSEEKEKCRGISDGTYSLVEGDEESVFYFFREDEEELPEEFHEELIHLFSVYIMEYLMEEEDFNQFSAEEIKVQISDDNKVARVIVCGAKKEKVEVEEVDEDEDEEFDKTPVGFFRKAARQLWGNKNIFNKRE